MGDPIDFKNNITEVEANIQNMLDQMARADGVQKHLSELGLEGVMEALIEERNYDLREAGLFDDEGITINSQEDLEKYLEETKEFAAQCNLVGSRLSHSIAEEPSPFTKGTLSDLGSDITESANQLAAKASLDSHSSDPRLGNVVKELNEVRSDLKSPGGPNGPS